MNGIQKTKALTIFRTYIENNEIYEGQIASSKLHFQKKLMQPILKIIGDLENE